MMVARRMYSVRALPQHESTRDWISEGQADLLGTVDVSDWNGRPHSLVAGWARKGGTSPLHRVVLRPSCGRS